jgi:hypothetical protein
MKKLTALLFFSVAFALHVMATHNRAGEITYKVLDCSQRLFRITITTYTKTSSYAADRPVLDSVHLGDGTVVSIPRSDTFLLPNNVKRNRYIISHPYAGPGRYKIWFIDPNRVENIVNMLGSVDVPFYLETTLIINPWDGCNNSPDLTYPPIDVGCINKLFIHNPVAVDPDGDSLSYQLTVPKMAPNTPVPGYFLPTPLPTLDPVTGDFVWNTPQPPAGEYNFAFYIIEWKNGHPIDTITRDMQVTIKNCSNNPPAFASVNDTCIVAGDTLTFNITASDPDGNVINLMAYGAPFNVQDSATFTSNSPNNPVTGIFDWKTKCRHIRVQPYAAVFRAQDIALDTNLVDLEHMNIRVIPPPAQNLVATPSGNSIVLNWQPGACATDKGYRIWRRSGQFNGSFNCPCETGVPSSSGFSLIATVLGNNNTTYTDFLQLVIGIEYCYVVTVIYVDGSESCPSNQACAKLKKELPVIINASVLSTHPSTGQVYVAWSKPDSTELDTVQFPPPYQYRLFHARGFSGGNFNLIATFFDINDTTFIDTGLNTADSAWRYYVEFYYDSAGIPTYKGKTQTASTIYLSIAPTDEQLNLSWQVHVPWTNHFYDIFRAAAPLPCYDTTGLIWDSIGRAYTQNYTDSNLANGTMYRYYVKSAGTYSAPGFDTTYNNSQEKCEAPYDNVPPCSPGVAVTADCVANANLLTWNNPNWTCADDVLGYYIYYRPALLADFTRIDSIFNGNDTSYIHGGLLSIAGCYYVTAFDTNRNESKDYSVVCVDTCYQYYLPNVFTPDGSGVNDVLHPCDYTTAPEMQVKCPPYQNVQDVDLKFFNRWGEVVFTATNRDINWDGRHKDNGKLCPDGVYYYTGIVNFISLSGIVSKELHGFVHLIRKK